jgi:hypothetical protein
MGPLTGFRIVEFAGIGPGPMAAMREAACWPLLSRGREDQMVNSFATRPASLGDARSLA